MTPSLPPPHRVIRGRLAEPAAWIILLTTAARVSMPRMPPSIFGFRQTDGSQYSAYTCIPDAHALSLLIPAHTIPWADLCNSQYAHPFILPCRVRSIACSSVGYLLDSAIWQRHLFVYSPYGVVVLCIVPVLPGICGDVRAMQRSVRLHLPTLPFDGAYLLVLLNQ